MDRPLYDPCNTEALRQEFFNLVLLRNIKGIVQLLASVVFINPYRTDQGKNHGLPVLRGLILEYHPYGNLQDLLRSELLRPEPKADYPWQRWAIQIANALDSLHHCKLAHLDLHLANVVFNTE
ncbi:hypothetical protein F5B19DRAFT_501061 [Rostrohypoxylon terebratum]|nr:hypothetical protein F5B19DRAFT_501061 [Rostrohypoxylon terebratum]